MTRSHEEMAAAAEARGLHVGHLEGIAMGLKEIQGHLERNDYAEGLRVTKVMAERVETALAIVRASTVTTASYYY